MNLMNWEQWLFFKWGFFGNYWIWFHMLGGALLGFTLRRYMNQKIAVLVTIAVTVLWEIYEFIDGDILEIYGSWERWSLDSLGDIVGALAVAILVIYSNRKVRNGEY